MTDSLKERLRALAARREMEGIYTDRNIAELALARIEELEAEVKQLFESNGECAATIAKLERERDGWKKRWAAANKRWLEAEGIADGKE